MSCVRCCMLFTAKHRHSVTVVGKLHVWCIRVKGWFALSEYVLGCNLCRYCIKIKNTETCLACLSTTLLNYLTRCSEQYTTCEILQADCIQELSRYTPHFLLIDPFKLPADSLLSVSREIWKIHMLNIVNKWQRQPISQCSEQTFIVTLKQDEE